MIRGIMAATEGEHMNLDYLRYFVKLAEAMGAVGYRAQTREEFRKVSVTAPACDRQIYGHGLDGYLEAIDFILAGKKERPDGAEY